MIRPGDPLPSPAAHPILWKRPGRAAAEGSEAGRDAGGRADGVRGAADGLRLPRGRIIAMCGCDLFIGMLFPSRLTSAVEDSSGYRGLATESGLGALRARVPPERDRLGVLTGATKAKLGSAARPRKRMLRAMARLLPETVLVSADAVPSPTVSREAERRQLLHHPTRFASSAAPRS